MAGNSTLFVGSPLGLGGAAKTLGCELVSLVLVIFIAAFAIIISSCVRDATERSVAASVRWKLNGAPLDAINKPLSYYWLYALFFLFLFLLIVVIIRFFVVTFDV